MPNRIKGHRIIPCFGVKVVGAKPSNKSIIEADPTGKFCAGSVGIDESTSNVATGALLS